MVGFFLKFNIIYDELANKFVYAWFSVHMRLQCSLRPRLE